MLYGKTDAIVKRKACKEIWNTYISWKKLCRNQEYATYSYFHMGNYETVAKEGKYVSLNIIKENLYNQFCKKLW